MTHDAYLWMSISIVAAAIGLSAPDMRVQAVAATTPEALARPSVALPVDAPALAPMPVAIAPRIEETAPSADVADAGIAGPGADEVLGRRPGADVAQPDLVAPAETTTPAKPERPVSRIVLRTAALLAAAKASAPTSPSVGHWRQLLGDDVDAELKCLALNIYWEARSEPALGRFAVAAVTLNRVGNKRFPNTVCGVVRQGESLGRHRCQFSWMCDDKSDKPENEAAWREAEHIAYSMLFLDLPDPTNGALWYHADYVSPGWAKAMARITQIGRHLFYRAAVREARNASGLAG